MEKADDLISWAIMNSPVPVESERPRPTPLFDAFSGHMRAIAGRVVGALGSRLGGWSWDAYGQLFLATVETSFPGIGQVTRRFELRLGGSDEWRAAFDEFRDAVARHLSDVRRVQEALRK